MTILQIAQSVADDINLARPTTLFGDGLGDGSRRLLRAITAVSRHLGMNYDWQQLRFDHSFRSVEGSLQPGALPEDFQRFVDGTFVDKTRKLQFCRGRTPQEWAGVAMYGYTQAPWQWRQQGNDLWMSPSGLAGSEISYTYVSKAIGQTTSVPPPIIHTTNQMLLMPGNRYVVGYGHILGVTTLAPGQFIELVPVAGTWLTLGAQILFQDGNGILPNTLPSTTDIITLTRSGSMHQIVAAFGQYTPYLEEAVNGQMLQAGKRYLLTTGQHLYLPVLRKGEFIELVPKNLSWVNTRVRLITRNGLTFSENKTDWRDGLVALVADMTSEFSYTVVADPLPLVDKPPTRLIQHFTTDTDESLWPEELMILGTIWRLNWRDGQPYNEDFRNFERAAYDTYKGEGHQGVISQRSYSDDPIGDRIRGLRNSAIVISDPTTWEVPR